MDGKLDLNDLYLMIGQREVEKYQLTTARNGSGNARQDGGRLNATSRFA